MMPYNGGRLTPVRQQPNSISLDSRSGTRSYSHSPVSWDLDGMHSPEAQDSPVEMGNYYQSQLSWDIDRAQRFRQYCSSSLGYEVDMFNTCSQYNGSPISAEMEKFFSFPAMSITFMPCVCVPDYPVEKGKPRKICRRCSVAQLTSAAEPESGSSTVAIDNKIEQAMDLVKSHLMFAVREEVEVLKVQIAELIERNNQLEYENGILRAAASPETLAKLAQPRQPPPSSSS